jgi:L,D-peptidoglycan transpeptidase YkuD (ErfK/YbiS/YcfS/YnhG family)
MFSLWAQAQIPRNAKHTAFDIIQHSSKSLDMVNQLLVVFNNDTGSKATLMAFERSGKRWKTKFGPFIASIGRNGFAATGAKVEGDGKTPTGIFALGQLFTYEPTIDTKLSFIQSNTDDKWVDDSTSADYNKYIRGNTDAKSFEHLLLNSIYYKYCMVIEYNTHPVVNGKGSAIFFHLADDNYTPTAGCVAIEEQAMQSILHWLDPTKHKAIYTVQLSKK